MEDSYVLQLSDRKFTDMYLCYCGYAKCQPAHSFGPSVRPNYLIHYILEGKGTYRIGKKEYHLNRRFRPFTRQTEKNPGHISGLGSTVIMPATIWLIQVSIISSPFLNVLIRMN